MIEKTVRRVAAAAALGAGELAVVGGVAGKLEQGLGEAGFFGEQCGVVRRRGDGVPGGFQCGFEPFAGYDEIGLRESPVVGPVRRDAHEPGLLYGFGGAQPQRVVEPEAHPGLQVLGRAVFALGREPRDFEVDLVGAEQRRAAATAEAHQHSSLGQFAHRRLSDRGAGAEQQRGGVGDWDVPVQRLLSRNCAGER